MEGTVHVVMASDARLITPLGVTALSAIKATSSNVRFWFLTPRADASHPAWHAIEDVLGSHGRECTIVPVDFDGSRLQLAPHVTATGYFRLLIPDLLPALGKAVYLDCDILVGRDLAPLVLGAALDWPLAAVEDKGFTDFGALGMQPGDGYFNSGVLVMDLVALRQQQLFTAVLEHATRHPQMLRHGDQDALNSVFRGRWHRLPREWNYQQNEFLADVERYGLAKAKTLALTSLFHFCSYDKPWRTGSAHPLRREYLAIGRPLTFKRGLNVTEVRQALGRVRRALKWRMVGLGLRSPFDTH